MGVQKRNVQQKIFKRMHTLIIGECGVGKTWVMKNLLHDSKPYKLGLICFHKKDDYLILGKYTGKMFDGSDALSMAVSKDFQKLKAYCDKYSLKVIAEGDRFTNQKFISIFPPTIVRIQGDGANGRKLRNSNQSLAHLRRIKTRVDNIRHTKWVENSLECLKYIKNVTKWT